MSADRSCLTPSAVAFAGHGEDAGLDLPADAATSSLLGRLLDGTHASFAEALADVGNCRRPIRLDGHSTTVDSHTGEILGRFASTDAPLVQLYVPCGNRRAHVCPACSRTYARDTFELIRAGVVGGKSVPASVSGAPLLFVTLTAPSFGLVHGVRADGGRCRPRRSDTAEVCPHGVKLSCLQRHEEDDQSVGAPLCADCYDWVGAVVWQWHAPVLWRRTTTALRRELARRLGTTERRLKHVASVQFAKVAEYQARGLVHFHALVRLDGPDGPGSPAPLDAADLAAALRDVVASTTVTAPPTWETDTARRVGWGRQLDVRVVTSRGAASTDRLEPEQVGLPRQVFDEGLRAHRGEPRQAPPPPARRHVPGAARPRRTTGGAAPRRSAERRAPRPAGRPRLLRAAGQVGAHARLPRALREPVAPLQRDPQGPPPGARPISAPRRGFRPQRRADRHARPGTPAPRRRRRRHDSRRGLLDLCRHRLATPRRRRPRRRCRSPRP